MKAMSTVRNQGYHNNIKNEEISDYNFKAFRIAVEWFEDILKKCGLIDASRQL